MDAISTQRLVGAHPQFIDRAQRLDGILLAHGINFRWTEVYRSMQQQAVDYALGRDANGVVISPRLVITNAKPGHSNHQYFWCGDGVPMVNGAPDWNVSGPNWQAVYSALPSIGLFSGKNFKSIKGDDDHVQMVEVPESPIDEDVALLISSGYEAVWAKYASILTPSQ